MRATSPAAPGRPAVAARGRAAVVAACLAAASLGAGSPAADPAASAEAARAAYASAAALQNREAWDLAAEEWRALVEAHPRDPLALKGRYYLAICLAKNGQWSAAEKTLREVVASAADAPTVELARWELARGTFAAAQSRPGPEAYAAAAARLREFLDTCPGHAQAADAAFFLGEAQWQSGDRAAAIATWRDFVRARADSPRLAEVLYALGVALAETGEAREAAAMLARCAEKFPDHPLAADVALWRADLALAAGKPADAEGFVAPALAGPRAAEALDRLGQARWSRKDWAGAAEAFAKLAADHPDSPRAGVAAVSAARALVEAGKPEAARPLFEKAAGGDGPEASDAAHRLCVLELEAGNPARALDVATVALATLATRKPAAAPLAPQLELDRAEALWRLPGRRPEATRAAAAIVAAHPASSAAAPALALAALGLLEERKPADAVKRIDAFLAARGAEAGPAALCDVRQIRAEALLALDDHAAAAAAYRELAADQPRDPRRPDWQLREAAALAAARQWRQAHELLAVAAADLEGDRRADALLLDATALVEMGQPGPAAELLAAIEKGHPQWPRRMEARLLAVRALGEAGDRAAALRAAERLVAEIPEGAGADVAWYRLGQLRQEAGSFDEAIAAFDRARAVAPEGSRGPWALLASGWCHEARGRLADAITAWSTLIDEQPRGPATPEALLARADARQRTGDFAGGLADARRLLEGVRARTIALDAAAAGEARLLEGLCLAGTADHGGAAAAFRRLLEEQPRFAAADRVLLELGRAQALDGRATEAEATFLALLQRHPDSRHAGDAWFEIGECRWGAKRWPEAADAYAAAVAAAEPAGDAGRATAEQARHKLAWTHVMRDDHAAAAEAFAAQLAADPEGPLAGDGRALLGDALARAGKPADAERELARALADPARLSSPELRGAAFVRAAEAAALQEKWTESLAFAERLLAADPQSPRAPEARYAAAWARQNLGRLDEALAGYRAVADVGGTELAARARLMEGEVLFEQGAHKDAIKAFFKAAYGFGEAGAPAAYHPWQAQATFEAARCFEVLGKADQARGLYAELVDRYPNSQHVPAARRRLDALGPAAKEAKP